MIPLSDLTTRIRTKHERLTGVRWSDADIHEIINEGLESLAEGTLFYERYVTVPVQQRTFYDLRGFTNETVVRINSVYSTSRSDWLLPISPNKLPFDWDSAAGEPQRFFTRGTNWYGVWPRATSDQTSGFHRVYFSGIPAPFTHPQAVLRDLPDNHYPALEDYCLYELAAQDREPARAIAHYKSYLKREKKLKDFMDGRLNHASIRSIHAFGGGD